MLSAKYSFFCGAEFNSPDFYCKLRIVFASVYDNLEAKRHVALNFF